MVQSACLKQLENGNYIFYVCNINPTTEPGTHVHELYLMNESQSSFSNGAFNY